MSAFAGILGTGYIYIYIRAREKNNAFTFSLASFLCFNGISTLLRLFNAKAILLEEQ